MAVKRYINGEWVVVSGLQGQQGLTGPQGIQGIQGEKGDTGEKGEQGIQGIQGIQGEKGDPGEKGEGAFYFQESEPENPYVGQIWVDSDNDVDIFSENVVIRKTFTATNNQSIFTLTDPMSIGTEQVYLNGVMLVKDVDYTANSSTQITLSSPADENDVLDIFSLTPISLYSAISHYEISANTTLVSSRYFVTSSSALTLTLPQYPVVNDQVEIFDASNNANTYNITVNRNGKLINGNAGNLIIDTAGGWYTLVYTGNTYGWKVK